MAENASSMEGGGQYVPISEDVTIPLDHDKFSRQSLQICGAIIEACKTCEDITALRLQKDDDVNMENMLEDEQN